MTVWALGINHTTAPLDLRGRFAFSLDQLPFAISALRDLLKNSSELALVSTCHRTEVYGAGDSQHTAHSTTEVLQWLAASGGVSSQFLQNHAYTLEDAHAARHAFRVAAGLDSMVLGETQILGQLKDAVHAAKGAGALGSTLHQMFQRSFSVAKAVRSTTDIGSQSISMAAAAVRLAGQLFEDLSKTKVLFIGAGQMIELAATYFVTQNPRQIVIANRSLERGQKLVTRLAPRNLANHVAMRTMPLGEVPAHLHSFDIVISCTASTLPIIGLGAVERAVKTRKRKPIFMLDLAVPRDIEPEVKALDDVYLYTVDDLANVVRTAKDNRQAAVAQAEDIVNAGVQDFLRWMALRTEGATTLIQQLNAQSDQWRLTEVARAKRMLSKGENLDHVLDALSRGVAQKFLHPAYSQLASLDADQRALAQDAVQRLYLKPGDALQKEH